MTDSTEPVPAVLRSSSPRGGFLQFIRGPWLLGIALFLLCLGLNTQHNDFPYTYHPDERGKVVQVIRRTRNFHHPLLMLNATDWVTRVAFIERTPQNVVQTGRWVIAAFAAGSVVALALLAYLAYGTLAGWAAGLVLAPHLDLFKTAHYMKEDPALMFGLSLALLGAYLWWRWPTPKTLRFLALACGLAASGKYLGILTLLFAVPLVWRRSGIEALLPVKARFTQFVIAFGLTFALCNAPLLVKEVSSPFRSIKREMDGVAGGHRGLTRDVPHGVYFDDLKANVPRPVQLLAGAYVLLLLATVRRRTPVEWVLVLFPLGYFAMLSFSPKIADRYLLPVTTLTVFLSALGAAEIARLCAAPESKIRNALSPLVLLGLTAWVLRAELPPYRAVVQDYQQDDPAAVAKWIVDHLPLTAVIAEDHRVNLSVSKGTPKEPVSKDARIPHTVLDADFVPDLGTLDELRTKGVTHVAVSKPTYNRFSGKDLKPRAGEVANFTRRKEFYDRLFEEGELVQEWPSGKITYLQPGIKLYRIGMPAEPPPGPPAQAP